MFSPEEEALLGLTMDPNNGQVKPAPEVVVPVVECSEHTVMEMTLNLMVIIGWRRGVVVNALVSINEITLCRAWLYCLDGWLFADR